MNGFTIYKEYYDLITLLSEKEQEQLCLAIWKYMFEDMEPNLNDKQMKIFRNLKRPLDISKSNSKRATKSKPNENQNKTKIKPDQNQSNSRCSSQRKAHQDVTVTVTANSECNNNLYEFIENEFNRTISSSEYEIISQWEDNDLTRYAIKQAVIARALNIRYIQRILQSYKAEGIKTLEEAKARDEKFRSSNSSNKSIDQDVLNYDWLHNEVDQ